VYARCVQGLEPKQRKKFDDELYGFTALNEAGNDVLRDIRAADEAMETTAGGIL
jgi:hypothetical protein